MSQNVSGGDVEEARDSLPSSFLPLMASRLVRGTGYSPPLCQSGLFLAEAVFGVPSLCEHPTPRPLPSGCVRMTLRHGSLSLILFFMMTASLYMLLYVHGDPCPFHFDCSCQLTSLFESYRFRAAVMREYKSSCSAITVKKNCEEMLPVCCTCCVT